MKTLLKFVIAVGLMVFVAAPIAYVSWFFYGNRVFASKLFESVPYDNVRASRRWHLEPFGCTFGVVSLGETAQPEPPEQLSGRKFPYNFPTEWQKTPGLELAQINMGWFVPCKDWLGTPTFETMSQALITPGGWWATSSEYVFLYSKPAKLAFRLRHGD